MLDAPVTLWAADSKLSERSGITRAGAPIAQLDAPVTL